MLKTLRIQVASRKLVTYHLQPGGICWVQLFVGLLWKHAHRMNSYYSRILLQTNLYIHTYVVILLLCIFLSGEVSYGNICSGCNSPSSSLPPVQTCWQPLCYSLARWWDFHLVTDWRMASFSERINTMPTKNRNTVPHTCGRRKAGAFFTPKWTGECKVACGSEVVADYIPSYLYTAHTETIWGRSLYKI